MVGKKNHGIYKLPHSPSSGACFPLRNLFFDDFYHPDAAIGAFDEVIANLKMTVVGLGYR